MQMDILRCKSPTMVTKEIAAHLLGYNLIRAAMTQAASTSTSLPRQLSFAAARRALVALQERLRHEPSARFSSEHVHRMLTKNPLRQNSRIAPIESSLVPLNEDPLSIHCSLCTRRLARRRLRQQRKKA